jgi:glycosyltransferase involved in cell wall biosynthesis
MPRPRHIWHTEASLGWGGQEIRILTELLALRERGHRVALVAPPASRIFAEAGRAGVPVHALDDRKLAYPRAILRLRRQLRAAGVQVLNPHSSRDGWIAGLAGRLAGTPLILRSRHIEVDYPNRFASRLVLGRLPHHVVTTSERIAQRLMAELGLAADRVTCIPTGLDLRRFDPATPPAAPGAPPWPDDVPVVGMISVLRSWKGHEYFLRAAAELAPRWPHVRFVIAGEGPMRDRIEAWRRELNLADRVELLGHRADVPAVLARLATVVLPSYAHEGVPQIVLQARPMGRAVVGTTVGGIPEVVRAGETGLLVPPRDAAALAAAIEALLRQPALAERLGRRARERALAEYGLDVMCARLEAIYDRHLG